MWLFFFVFRIFVITITLFFDWGHEVFYIENICFPQSGTALFDQADPLFSIEFMNKVHCSLFATLYQFTNVDEWKHDIDLAFFIQPPVFC